MSNTTPKTEQELANESFDKRMKKEAYKGKQAKWIRDAFVKCILKYSTNSMKATRAYLRQLVNKKTTEYNYYDIGVMLNVIRGAAFEFIGCNNEFDFINSLDIIEEEYNNFNKIAHKCDEAAVKEAKSKIKVAKK